ncbi:unnamed protein product [Didymodactylos carnosus]|uniref:Uncharacterized protein n=1 Tax=Didymodactylos carnosus TaxID=1234261 RepID=A0A8S2CNQ2_9BILA|nr:unnamed protein product [Didymodactylos carnosus]CAF3516487.1 unnamed protein product [Didymodactylos carnosus]
MTFYEAKLFNLINVKHSKQEYGQELFEEAKDQLIEVLNIPRLHHLLKHPNVLVLKNIRKITKRSGVVQAPQIVFSQSPSSSEIGSLTSSSSFSYYPLQKSFVHCSQHAYLPVTLASQLQSVQRHAENERQRIHPLTTTATTTPVLNGSTQHSSSNETISTVTPLSSSGSQINPVLSANSQVILSTSTVLNNYDIVDMNVDLSSRQRLEHEKREPVRSDDSANDEENIPNKLPSQSIDRTTDKIESSVDRRKIYSERRHNDNEYQKEQQAIKNDDRSCDAQSNMVQNKGLFANKSSVSLFINQDDLRIISDILISCLETIISENKTTTESLADQNQISSTTARENIINLHEELSLLSSENIISSITNSENLTGNFTKLSPCNSIINNGTLKGLIQVIPLGDQTPPNSTSTEKTKSK